MDETEEVVVQEGSSSASDRKVRHSDLVKRVATRVIFDQPIDKELIKVIAVGLRGREVYIGTNQLVDNNPLYFHGNIGFSNLGVEVRNPKFRGDEVYPRYEAITEMIFPKC